MGILGLRLPVPHPRGRRQGGPPGSRAGLSCVIRLQSGGRSHGHPRSSWGQNILENESGRIQGGDTASQVPAGLGGTRRSGTQGGREEGGGIRVGRAAGTSAPCPPPAPAAGTLGPPRTAPVVWGGPHDAAGAHGRPCPGHVGLCGLLHPMSPALGPASWGDTKASVSPSWVAP